MNDEKKPCGGVTPELNDEALDAVTGGTGRRLRMQDLSLADATKSADDFLKQLMDENNNLDQTAPQP